MLPRIGFTHPTYLLLLLAWLPAILWWHRRSLAGLAPHRARLALVLRLILGLLLVFALAGMQVTRPARKLAVLFVLDRSNSIPEELRQASLQFVNQAAERMGRDDLAGLVVFGADPHLEVEASPALRLGQIHSLPGRDFTDIAAAIRLALAAFPDDAQKRIVLITDGNENLGAALQEAQTARAAGAQIDVVPIRYRYPNEILVEKLIAPAEAKVGEPFEVRAIVSSTAAGAATLRLFRDGQQIATRRIAVRPGKNLVRFEQSLTRSVPHTFEVTLEGEPDQLRQNNRALALTLIRGRPRVLLVASEAADARFLASALRTQKIDVEVREPGQLPRSLAEFQAFDTIILSDVSADRLTPAQMRMIQNNVRDTGAGLIMVGGVNSFGPGAWRGTPVEEALPVSMEVRKQRVMPTGAIAMVLHTCEFPDGNRWARQTAALVIDALGPDDEVGVLLFGSFAREEWGIELQRARDKEFLKSRLFQLNPGDMPHFQRILEMARDGLRRSRAAVKHILIISDADPQPPSDALIEELRRLRISISTVTVFPHSMEMGVATMVRMAERTGGRHYLVQAPEEIPAIFLKEAQRVLKSAIVEEPFTPRVLPDAPLLRGLSPPPPLRGYVAVSPKEAPGVEVLMASHKDDPVLVTWRYGLGKAIAFTSDATNRWAAPWIAEWGAQFNQFWAQLVRWSLRSTARANFDTAVEIHERRGRVILEALDARGRFLNFLDLRGTVTSERQSTSLRMEQTAPGRYEGTFEALDTGQYLITLSYADPAVGQRIHTIGAAVPYSPEYAEIEANEPLLTGLPEVTGGQLHPALTEPGGREATYRRLFRHDRRSHSAPVDVWPVLVLAATWLLLVDIAVRRVLVTPGEVIAWCGEWLAPRLERWGLRRRQEGRIAPEALRRLRHAKWRARRRIGDEPPPPAAESPAPAPPPPTAAEPPPQPTVVWNRPVPGLSDRSDATPTPPASPPQPSPGEAPAAAREETTARLLRAKQRARQRER